MKLSSEYYKVYQILTNLHERIGDSEFGYRIQGLFAHTLIGLGVKILEINPQGHPDILGEKQNQYRFEIEVILSDLRKRTINKEDVEAIKPLNKNEIGYMAFLHYNIIPEWLLIDYEHIKYRVSEPISIIILKSLSDKNFSNECTQYFYDLILSNEPWLYDFTFRFLCDKAIKGEKL